MQKMTGLNEAGRVIGESHPKAKLTWDDINLIRDCYEEHGMTQKLLAEKFEVGITTIHDIVRYKTWVDVPVKWIKAKSASND